MKNFILSVVAVCSLGVAGPALAAVKGQEVVYQAGGTTLKGYVAYDDAVTAKRPAVLVVHEWWGVNDYTRKRADMLAQLGYVALAVDMYGNGKQAKDPKEAGNLSQEIYQNPVLAKERFTAGLEYLKQHELVDASHIAAIGYCFGGSTVLNMAMASVDLNGVVSFHGSIPTPPAGLKPGDVKAKILVCHGNADGFIKPEQMDALKQGLDKAQADYQIITYDDAKHAFTNPEADMYAQKFDLPIAYNAAADQKSWDDMQAFFKTIFGR